MWFYITMFVCNMLIPLIMIMGGYFMSKHTPEKINSIYGYRTRRSMKNQETWKFAHKYCGRLWLRLGAALCVATVIVQILFIGSSDDTIGHMTLIIETVQIVLLIASIYPVERALKNNFDENGNKIES